LKKGDKLKVEELKFGNDEENLLRNFNKIDPEIQGGKGILLFYFSNL